MELHKRKYPAFRWLHMRLPRSSGGWTLTELLIVVAMIAVLAVIFLLVNWRRNINRAHDARRKTDLANIRRAFEEYYNDKDCYPPAEILDSCGSSDLDPYMKRIPCDPATRQPYLYEPDDPGDMCQGNRICAQLTDKGDPDIRALGCHFVDGCGWGAGWNYCVANGSTVTLPGFNPYAVPTPTLEPTPFHEGRFACSSAGVCGDVGFPAPMTCPRSWNDQWCSGTGNWWNNQCAGHPEFWCE